MEKNQDFTGITMVSDRGSCGPGLILGFLETYCGLTNCHGRTNWSASYNGGAIYFYHPEDGPLITEDELRLETGYR